eukprot:7937834-Pyramimonas_sp.AAC.1
MTAEEIVLGDISLAPPAVGRGWGMGSSWNRAGRRRNRPLEPREMGAGGRGDFEIGGAGAETSSSKQGVGLPSGG